MTASVLKQDAKHTKGSKERYLLAGCVSVLINNILLNLLCVWILCKIQTTIQL